MVCYEFNMEAALAQASMTPRPLDDVKIAADTERLRSSSIMDFLTQNIESARNITLAPAEFIQTYPDCPVNAHLSAAATDGVQPCYPPGFIHNMGVGNNSYGANIAHDDLVAFLISNGLRDGKWTMVPLDLLLQKAKEESLLMELNPCFVVKKPSTASSTVDTGRLVVHLRNLNNPANKIVLQEKFEKIKATQMANICTLIENAHIVFPGTPLEGMRRDVDSAFNKLLNSVQATLNAVFSFTYNGIKYAVLSAVALMGDQAVNSVWDQCAKGLGYALKWEARLFTGSPLALTEIATDDMIYFGSTPFINHMNNVAVRLVGTGATTNPSPHAAQQPHPIPPQEGSMFKDALSIAKDIRSHTGSMIALGWRFDPNKKLVSPNGMTFAKLVRLLFCDVPFSPAMTSGTAVKARTLMRLSAHMIRTAAIVHRMLPFSRGISRIIHTCTDPDKTVHLDATAVFDIEVWRHFILEAMTDISIMTSPTFAPPLIMRLHKDESWEEREARQAAAASYHVYSDACTGTAGPDKHRRVFENAQIGIWIPDKAWCHWTLPPEFAFVATADDTDRTADINVFEFIALVMTALLAAMHLPPYDPSNPNHSHRHIHIFCDNTSSLFRARLYRAKIPIYSFLLILLSQVQAQFHCLITFGFIKGELNVTADAVSRNFNCPHGESVRKALKETRQWHILPELMRLIEIGRQNSSRCAYVEAARSLTAPGSAFSCAI